MKVTFSATDSGQGTNESSAASCSGGSWSGCSGGGTATCDGKGD